MELTNKEKRQLIWREIKDLFTGAAFPLMLQLILSASIILFADYSGEVGLQVFALIFGELLLMGAYFIFGRQNGIAAYRRTVQNEKKRELESTDITVYYKTGEYAVWKGIVIGLISLVPYLIFEFVQCVAPNVACEFMLKYAFGWAAYPFILIEQIPSVGEISEWLNFIWIIFPLGVHLGAYIFGAYGERKRQKLAQEAREIKGKRRK